ncbi:MAG: GMP/IMP nucleotidase [Immundisolibacteraceae bacterium]|nr:GMP/IMP nucleotidase [Immundisolibacteraceae bacterium]
MVEWDAIDTVLLDMDGTLLDLRYDNQFWLDHLPGVFGARENLSIEQARAAILDMTSARQGTLEFYCLDHWSKVLQLNVAELNAELGHLVQMRPNAERFLRSLRTHGIRTVLVTNSHRDGIDFKMDKTGMEVHLDRVICAHDLGFAKEQQGFWRRLHEIEPFDPDRTLLVDDNISVLDAAAEWGVRYLLAVTRPDSGRAPVETGSYAGLDDFAHLLPG